MIATDASAARAPQAATVRKVLYGLAWREWQAWGAWCRGFFSLWLIVTWVLPLISNPLLVLAYGCVYALVAGVCTGALDTAGGAEEFELALPATRAQRFRVKLLMGLAPLLGMTIVGSLAVYLDLPQALWGLLVQTGITEPFGSRIGGGPLFLLATVAPLALYSMTFLFGLTSRTRMAAILSPLPALLVTGSLLGLCLLLETTGGRVATVGDWSIPVLTIASVGALVLAYRMYRNKELSAAGRGGLWWMCIAGIITILMLAVLIWLSLKVTT